MFAHRKQGFTLIELLVVIVIIAILAAILFPVFARAREKSFQTNCLNNQRQIATSLLMVAQDHDELFSNSATVWVDLNLGAQVLTCPTIGADMVNAYGYNLGVSGVALGNIAFPADVALTADCRPVAKPVNLLTAAGDVDLRHDGKAVISYVDGHVVSSPLLKGIGTIPVTNGLVADYRADIGAPGAKWADMGPNGFNLAPIANGALPVLSGDVIGNVPGLRWKKSVSYPMSASITGKSLTDTTMVLVFNRLDSHDSLLGRLDNSARLLGTGGSPWFGFSYRDTAGTMHNGFLSGNQFTANTPYICTACQAGTALCVYNGGATSPFFSGTAPVTPATITSLIAIGNEADGGGGSPSNLPGQWGDLLICEYIIYDHALSGTELTTLQTYLKKQYRL